MGVVVDPKGAFGGDAMAPTVAPKEDLAPTPWEVVQAEKEDVVKAEFKADPAKAAEVVDKVVKELGEEFVAENPELVEEEKKEEFVVENPEGGEVALSTQWHRHHITSPPNEERKEKNIDGHTIIK